MFDFAPVDKLEVQILIDDVFDLLSTVPVFAESEFGYLFRTGKMPVVEANACAAPCTVLLSCHRISRLAEARDALTNALGDQVVAPCAVGKRYIL